MENAVLVMMDAHLRPRSGMDTIGVTEMIMRQAAGRGKDQRSQFGFGGGLKLDKVQVSDAIGRTDVGVMQGIGIEQELLRTGPITELSILTMKLRGMRGVW